MLADNGLTGILIFNNMSSPERPSAPVLSESFGSVCVCVNVCKRERE